MTKSTDAKAPLDNKDRTLRLGPRVIFAGTASGVGKTTMAVAAMAGLSAGGVKVAPAKIGPDFIDPSYHKLACGVDGRSLDTFMLGPDHAIASLAEVGRNRDITVIEGVMGLFDGTLMERLDLPTRPAIDPRIVRGSTAEIAALTRTPVILVVDASATSSSLGPVVEGFRDYSNEVDIAGLLINNYGTASHLKLILGSLKDTGIQIVGAVPKGAVPVWRSRHLGLVPAAEDPDLLQRSVLELTDRLDSFISLPAIEAIARSAPGITVTLGPAVQPKSRRAKVAVAGGKAFSFYYPENITALENAGAEVEFFDPMVDSHLPAGTQGLYIGGGFPEVFAPQLSQNRDLTLEIRESVRNGMPTWAECGGLMWMARTVDALPMVGAIEANVSMSKVLTLGYLLAHSNQDNILSEKGCPIYGHEFHYSLCEPNGKGLQLQSRNGIKSEGFASGSIFASYMHIHLGGQQHIANRFVSKCL